ncbi:MAG: DUF3592 domain-containing protein [Microscillaceae bacterium]|nr:DUF3592 domain-containing protein [Microscillaceae bacterium]
MMAKKPFRNTLMITGLIALISIISVIYAYLGTSSFLGYAQNAKGTIVGFEKQRKVFRPIVEFTTQAGEKVRFTTLMGSEDTLVVKTGTKVKVLYHPKNPAENAVLNDFWQIWFPPMMILLFGISPFLFVLLLKTILVPPAKKTE